ncbi:MAG: flavohemoglobin expression-modulating QEGLA motif protein [Wenzhouxiangellaceae bacterium]
MPSTAELQQWQPQLTELLEQLCELEQSVRILSSLSWPQSVRQRFLAADGRQLPQVEYDRFDAAGILSGLADLRQQAQRVFGSDNEIGAWLQRLLDSVEHGARLLGSIGSHDFLHHSNALFGTPERTLSDGKTTVLALAENFSGILEGLDKLPLNFTEQPIDAGHLAAQIEKAVQKKFAADAPVVELVDELSAKALAGSTRIRIRRDARFTSKDVAQLIHHEAFIHVATKLNGKAQQQLPILGRSHAGTTATQEGLAVFAEFITGSMELDRLRRLTDRVMAIQMAIDGADFIQVYEYFLERSGGRREQSFENTRRVFRGGVLTGGAPFTKDIVYLEGLLRVHNFLRTTVSLGRSDLLHLLFCGKLDIEDIGVIAGLAAAGICQPPRYLPPWMEDLGFLLSYLAYSSFLNTVDMSRLREHYRQLAQDAPICQLQSD